MTIFVARLMPDIHSDSPPALLDFLLRPLAQALTQVFVDHLPYVVDDLAQAAEKARDDEVAAHLRMSAARIEHELEGLAADGGAWILRGPSLQGPVIDELAAKIREACNTQHQFLVQRVADITGGSGYAPLSEHPVSAHRVAGAIITVLKPHCTSPDVQGILRKSLFRHLVLPAASALSQIAALAASLPHSLSKRSGTSASGGGQISETSASVARHVGKWHRRKHTLRVRAEALPDRLVREAEAGQAFASLRQLPPYTQSARVAWFEMTLLTLASMGFSEVRLHRVQVLAKCFLLLVDDQTLPSTALPWIWKLLLPLTTLTLVEGSGSDGESTLAIRTLSAVCQAIETGQLTQDDGRLASLIDSIVASVSLLDERLRALDEQASAIYGQTLLRVDGALSAIEALSGFNQGLRTELRNERRNFETRPSRNEEVEVTALVRKFVESCIADHPDASPTSTRFLRDYWIRHLRSCWLREGQGGPAFQVASQVMQDLLVATRRVEPVAGSGGLNLPPLIRMVSHGIAAMGARREDFRALFDELTALQLKGSPAIGRLAAKTQVGAASEPRSH